MFPVEVRYWPLDEILQDRGDYTYLDAAASAVDEILRTSREGDLLVFLPSERDIRETRERLERRKLRGVEILPLFGRLTAGEQQRVFAPGDRRRVVLATNIAETSLTIPRIRYVVDTAWRACRATIPARIPSGCPSNRFRRAAPASGRGAVGGSRTGCAFASTRSRTFSRALNTPSPKSSAPISPRSSCG